MADGSKGGMTQRQGRAQATLPTPIPGEEIAVAYGERDITRAFLKPDGTLYNEDVVLQLQAGGDLRVYEDLLRDDQVSSTFEQRRSAVTGANWSVEPGAEDAASVAAATWLEENLRRVGWDSVTEQMLYARFYGWGVAELLWDVIDGKLGWREIKVRDRKRFLFQANGKGYLDTGVGSASPLGRIYTEAPYFWNVSAGADHSDNPYGRGLAHQLFWPVRFKRDGIRFWLVYLEKFAMPTAIGKMPATSDTGTNTTLRRQRLLAAIRALQTQAGVVIPDDMVIELLEAKRTGSADYGALHARMDAAIAKIVVGQTLTSDVGDSGSRALGDVHNSVRMDLVKSDADLICESFNRGPATWLTELNFAGAKPPRVSREVEEKADLGALATQLVQLKNVGFRPKLTLVQANWGADMEENPDPPPGLQGLGPDGKPLPPKPGQRKPGDDPEQDDQDDDQANFAAAIAELFPDQGAIDGALDVVETRLAEMSRVLLNPVLDYAATHTPAQLLGAIAEALPGWKPDQLEQALARVIFVSRTWGRINGTAP